MKIVSILLVIIGLLIASIEVYPHHVEKIEESIGIEFLDKIENITGAITKKINKATEIKPQRSTEDIVNDETQP